MALTRLLFVEDDRDLRDFVKAGMSREGFVVDAAADGPEALRRAEGGEYDAILLDVMLPRQDGFSVLKALRAKGYKGAVLMVTCRGEERDKLQGLNGGADDYIIKPVLLAELVARVRAVLRRTSPAGPRGGKASALKAADLHMNLLKHEVRRGDRLVHLTKKEYDLLEVLMRRPDQVISQADLTQHLSDTGVTSQTNVIEVHIKNLRAKLDSKNGPSLIRTVRGCGYALDV